MCLITSSEKCKLKQKDTTTHLFEWPKSGTVITLNSGKGMKQQEFSDITGESVK